MGFPISDGTLRPFRLWNAQEKAPLPHRYYSIKENAHIGALIEARWAEIGTTIEVYNAATGRLLGQYTRRVHSVTFNGGG
jgi:hypothetical protein